MRKILILLFAVIIFGCEPTLDITPKQVESDFNLVLKVGDSSEKIESYFKSENIDYSFDDFSNRYQSIIRHPDSNYHAIVIHVYVDSNKNYLKVEARDSYTAI